METEQSLFLPKEVYGILDGQIVITAPRETVDRIDLKAANTIFRVCDRLHIQKPKIIFSHSDTKKYRHKIFAKPSRIQGTDYVWMFPANNVKAFVENYYNLSTEDIAKALYLKKSTWERTQPTLVPIKAEDLLKVQEKEMKEINRKASEWDGLDAWTNPALIHSIEFLTDVAPSKDKIEKQLKDIISDALYYDIEIDYDEIIEKIKKDGKRKYYLWLDDGGKEKEEHENVYKKVDIYVSKTDKLDLTAIHKAVYLAFLISEEGETLDDISLAFYDRVKAIYKMLPDSTMDVNNGILSKDFLSTTTLNGYRTEIRNAIKKHISNKNIVDEFAIEGYKRKPFKIKRSTPELREEVIKLFELQ